MSEEYRAMWESLGLDLEAHDQLLSALGEGYRQLFLSREGRPRGMEYFDFVMSEVHGLRIKELLAAKAEGRKVVGAFCVFVPEELVRATGSELVGEYHERVGGWSAGVLVNGEGWEVTAEGLGAVKAYEAEDLDGDGDGEGDRPVAWNVEAAWQRLESVEVAVRVEGTREYVGQPRVQYGAVVSWAPMEGVNLSAEVLRGEYDEDYGEGVDSRTVVTTQLAAEF